MHTLIQSIIVLITATTISATAFAQSIADVSIDDAIVALFDQPKYKDSRSAVVSDLDQDDVQKLQHLLRQATGTDVTAEATQQEAQRLGSHARRAGANWKSKIGIGTSDYAGNGAVGVYAETAGKTQILLEHPEHTFRYSSADPATGSPAMSSDGRLIDAQGRVVKYVQFKASNNPITTYQSVLGDFISFDESRQSGAPAPIEGRIPDDQFDELVRRGKIDQEGRLTERGRADLDLESKKLALTKGPKGDRARNYLKRDATALKDEVRFAKIGQTYEQLDNGQKRLAKASAKIRRNAKANAPKRVPTPPSGPRMPSGASASKIANTSSSTSAGKNAVVVIHPPPAQPSPRTSPPPFPRAPRPSPPGTGFTRGAGMGLGALQVLQGFTTLTQDAVGDETTGALVRRQIVGGTQVASGSALTLASAQSLTRSTRVAAVVAVPLLLVSEAAIYCQYSAGDMSWSQYRLHCFESGGGLAGGFAGAWAGGAAGGVIGTAICPGPGTLVGGTVGMITGGIAGGFVGASLTREAAIALYGQPE